MQAAYEPTALPLIPLQRSRTDNMWAILDASPLVIEDKCLIFNDKIYRIIDSTLMHWSLEDNFASIGGNVTDREILLIHTQQGKLHEQLNAFLLHISSRHLKVESYNRHSQFFAFTPKDQIERLLNHLATLVSQTLQPNKIAIQRIIDQKIASRERCIIVNGQHVPCIDFEEYLNGKFGVCRLYAVLTCLHLANLIKHHYLPQGEIKLKRFNTVNGAHAIACFTHDRNCWTIDPTVLFANNMTIYQAVACTNNDSSEEITATLPLDESFDEARHHSNENSASPSQFC